MGSFVLVTCSLEWRGGLLILGLRVGRDDAVETSIAEQFKNDKASFEKTAKAWTKQYAK